ncbi:hypothetical protein PENSPDRAFT_679224 [Peniophora sp. CONT]|nr:hypothetical protein PENSPDRAFT_679224 [Peniophora sp. CONT]
MAYVPKLLFIIRSTRTPNAQAFTFAVVAPPAPASQSLSMPDLVNLETIRPSAFKAGFTLLYNREDYESFHSKTSSHSFDHTDPELGRVVILRLCRVYRESYETLQSQGDAALAALEARENLDVSDVLDALRAPPNLANRQRRRRCHAAWTPPTSPSPPPVDPPMDPPSSHSLRLTVRSPAFTLLIRLHPPHLTVLLSPMSPSKNSKNLRSRAVPLAELDALLDKADNEAPASPVYNPASNPFAALSDDVAGPEDLVSHNKEDFPAIPPSALTDTSDLVHYGPRSATPTQRGPVRAHSQSPTKNKGKARFGPINNGSWDDSDLFDSVQSSSTPAHDDAALAAELVLVALAQPPASAPRPPTPHPSLKRGVDVAFPSTPSSRPEKGKAREIDSTPKYPRTDDYVPAIAPPTPRGSPIGRKGSNLAFPLPARPAPAQHESQILQPLPLRPETFDDMLRRTGQANGHPAAGPSYASFLRDEPMPVASSSGPRTPNPAPFMDSASQSLPAAPPAPLHAPRPAPQPTAAADDPAHAPEVVPPPFNAPAHATHVQAPPAPPPGATQAPPPQDVDMDQPVEEPLNFQFTPLPPAHLSAALAPPGTVPLPLLPPPCTSLTPFSAIVDWQSSRPSISDPILGDGRARADPLNPIRGLTHGMQDVAWALATTREALFVSILGFSASNTHATTAAFDRLRTVLRDTLAIPTIEIAAPQREPGAPIRIAHAGLLHGITPAQHGTILAGGTYLRFLENNSWRLLILEPIIPDPARPMLLGLFQNFYVDPRDNIVALFNLFVERTRASPAFRSLPAPARNQLMATFRLNVDDTLGQGGLPSPTVQVYAVLPVDNLALSTTFLASWRTINFSDTLIGAATFITTHCNQCFSQDHPTGRCRAEPLLNGDHNTPNANGPPPPPAMPPAPASLPTGTPQHGTTGAPTRGRGHFRGGTRGGRGRGGPSTSRGRGGH